MQPLNYMHYVFSVHFLKTPEQNTQIAIWVEIEWIVGCEQQTKDAHVAIQQFTTIHSLLVAMISFLFIIIIFMVVDVQCAMHPMYPMFVCNPECISNMHQFYRRRNRFRCVFVVLCVKWMNQLTFSLTIDNVCPYYKI